MKFGLLIAPLGIGVPARVIMNRAAEFLIWSGVSDEEVRTLRANPRELIERARKEMRQQTGQELLPIPSAAGTIH